MSNYLLNNNSNSTSTPALAMSQMGTISSGSEASHSYPLGPSYWHPVQTGMGRLEMFMGLSGENAKRWLDKFKELAVANKWITMEQKKVQMGSLLEATAKSWWEAKKIHQLATWNQVEEAFLKNFDLNTEAQLFHAINNRIQAINEPVAHYAYEVEILFNQIDTQLPEKQKVQYLLKGLVPYLKDYLIKKIPFPTTYDQAVQAVMDKEKAETLLKMHYGPTVCNVQLENHM
jgi:hypothetical protein